MFTLYAIVCRLLLLLGVAGFALAGGLLAWRAPGLAILVATFIAWRRLRRWRGTGWTFGTARPANADDLYDGRMIGGKDGLILGRAGASRPSRTRALRLLLTARPSESATACQRFLSAYLSPRWGRGGIIRLGRFVHLATFAPTGRGKGIRVLVPNLLSYRGSCVVTDPKGELFHLTAAHRKKRFKHRIVRLDPFEVCGPGADTFNLMDMIDPDSPHLIDQARELANALVIRTGNEHEPHWNDSAELVLTAMIAFVAAMERRPEMRNLQTVRKLVASKARYQKAISAMQTFDVCGGMLKRAGDLLTWHVDRELGSILSTVHRQTAFLDSQTVAAGTARSSQVFRGAEFRRGGTGSSRRPGLGTLLAALIVLMTGGLAVVSAVVVPLPVPAYRVGPQRAYRQGWEDRSDYPYGLTEEAMPPEETPAGWQSWLREAKAGVARVLGLFPASQAASGRADLREWDGVSLPYGLAEKIPPEEDTSAGWRAWLRKATSSLPRLTGWLPARAPERGETSPVASRKEPHPWDPVTMKAPSPRSPASSAR